MNKFERNEAEVRPSGRLELCRSDGSSKSATQALDMVQEATALFSAA
jgi:hypothetical protein